MFGDVFWINNSSLPDPCVYSKLADGLSNDKVQFKGLVKSGIAELMAVHHRRAHLPHNKIVTAMLGIITDSVMRR